MRRTQHPKRMHKVFAFAALLGMSGGCITIYSFDDFETKAPQTCTSADQCKTDSPACGTPTCDEICKLTNLVTAGTLSRNHVIGDCQRRFCDGLGNEVVELDPTNVRSDGVTCTKDICIDNKPENIVADAETPCGIPGTEMTVKCDGMGVCRGCTADADCGIKTACADWACENGACVKKLQPIGKEVENPSPGDCRKNLCNAAGESPNTFSAEDAPDDNDPCTLDYCTTDYEIKHDKVSAGTKCGNCAVCNAEGSCNPCDAATSDCYNGECVPKPQPCTANGDCASMYCVDGYCCNGECSAKCMACSELKTGVLSGICAPVTNGTDPDNECNTPLADSCFDGVCGCVNGVKDANEEGIDCGLICGNSCGGKWVCGGPKACAGDNTAQVCCPDFGCNPNNCPDQTGACNEFQNVACALGAPPQTFTIGSVIDFSCPFIAGWAACRSVTCTCQ